MIRKAGITFIILAALFATNASAFWVNEQFNGQWAEVGNADARRGVNIQFVPTGPRDRGVLFFTVFVNVNGEDLWLSGTAGGVTPGEDTFDVSMVQVDGGNFFGGPDGSLGTSPIADFTFEFNTCDSLSVSWTGTGTPDVGSGSAEFDRGSSSIEALAVDRGQCVYQTPPSECPDFAESSPAGDRFCAVSGTFENEEITFDNSHVWVLNGPVFFGGPDNTGPATLNIEPGTYIVGASGSDALIIRRGSQVFADGNRNAPIVVTSATDVISGTPDPVPGDVGGFAIFGNAPSNNCTTDPDPCDAAFEGFPGEQFGGDDPDDSSGIVRFFQVRFAGNPIVQDQELNSFTISGVGAGTIIEYVQTHAGLDDGIEVFSGTVDLKYLVFTNIVDDNLDVDLGAKLNVQYGLIVQGPFSNDRGYEWDNNPNNNSAEPRTEINLSNFTLIGDEVDGSIGMVFRTGVGANVYNTFVTGFGAACVDIDDAETFNNAGSPGNLTGNLTVQGSATGSCLGGNFDEEGSDAFAVSEWWNSQGNLTGLDPMFVPGTVFPSEGSPLLDSSSVVPQSVFFNRETHIGAFRSQNDRWTDGWTFQLEETIQQALGQ